MPWASKDIIFVGKIGDREERKKERKERGKGKKEGN
jgi:hypothetical protein